MSDLRERGILLKAHGDRLQYSPRSSVTPELAQRMKAHKVALLAILTADDIPAAALWQTALDSLEGDPEFPPEMLAGCRRATVRWESNRPGTYWAFRRELETSVTEKGTQDFIIAGGSPALGESWDLGDAQITFLSGFAALPAGWDVGVSPSSDKFESKSRNAVSIVVRLTYDGRAILFGGYYMFIEAVKD